MHPTGEKGFEGACITVDAVGGKVRGAHTDNHCIQIRLLEHGNVHLYIQVPRHGLKLGLITLQSLSASPFVFLEMMKSEKVSSMVALTTNLILAIISVLLIS